MKNKWFLLALLMLFPVSIASAESEAPARPWSYQEIGLIPIQNGGRVKPFDSFAREIILHETGSRKFQGREPIDLLLSWIAFPDYWEKQPLIRVNREDVRRQLNLDEKRTHFSPQELFGNPVLLQYAERGQTGAASAEPPGAPRKNPRDQELRGVLDRLGTFKQIVSGQGWALIPRPFPQPWAALTDSDLEGNQIRNQFIETLRSYQEGDPALFDQAVGFLKTTIEAQIPQYSQNMKSKIGAESLYNRTRPFLWAWILYLLASIAWTLDAFRGGKVLRKSAGTLTLLGVAAQVFGIALRCFVAGRPPVTNMYESVIWVSIGILVFAGILFWVHRQGVILAVATFLAMLGLIAGDAAPAILDSSLNPLVPVLRSNYWLTIHVLTITLGYAAFALSLGLANIALFQFAQGEKGPRVLALNQFTYRAIQFGVVFIAAGTILGGIWADYSWGRFWGWDPKEVWALITLLAYVVILHGRYTSWMGQFGFAAWSAVSFMTVVMAWYGVNFILGAGLHSYGFASGGTPWVLGFVGAQLAYILATTGIYFSRRKNRFFSGPGSEVPL